MTTSTSNRQINNWQGGITNGATALESSTETGLTDDPNVEETYELLPSGD